MELDYLKLVAELGGVGITLVLILKFIPGLLKNQKEEREQFMKVVGNHLKHADKTQRESNKASILLSGSLQKLTDIIEKNYQK